MASIEAPIEQVPDASLRAKLAREVADIKKRRPWGGSKAKGLSLYARQHAEKVGHVDAIAKIGGTYRRLHLDREAIRIQVDDLSDSGQKELEALLEREG